MATISATANITGGNVLTGGLISATGNVSGNYFIGNGALLSGIAGGTPSAISSGTSNVSVTIANGNISASVGGTANIVVLSTTGQYVTGLMSATGNITGGNLITAGLASVTGNVNIGNATGVTWANASGARAWTYYNNTASSLDTVFL